MRRSKEVNGNKLSIVFREEEEEEEKYSICKETELKVNDKQRKDVWYDQGMVELMKDLG